MTTGSEDPPNGNTGSRVAPVVAPVYVLGGFTVVVLFLVVVALYQSGVEWTGFTERVEREGYVPMKTLWDWQALLIVPLLLALAAWLLGRAQKEREQKAQEEQRKRDQELEAIRARNNLLQTYLNDMTQVLLHDGVRATDDNARAVVKAVVGARTAAVLLGLDATRKRRIVKFLYELALIQRDKTLDGIGGIDLWSADFNDANLEEASLPKVLLKDAFLRRAKLKYANLKEADLRNTDLTHADLTHADLTHADLTHADLKSAELRHTTFSGTNLSGADLREAKGLTQEQIEQAKGDHKTQLPDDLQRPQSWSTRSEQTPESADAPIGLGNGLVPRLLERLNQVASIFS